MSDAETIVGTYKRREVPTERIPEGENVEVDEDEASVLTSASIYNGNSDNSSLLAEYRVYLENGRTYQATRDSGLKMPSDPTQFRAMSANHLVQCILECHSPNPLFRSPIRSSPKNILDLGTGQGQWVVDVADRFPMTQVVGIDLYPPPQNWIPGNCVLEVDDFTQPWSWPQNQRFELIHGRFLIGSVSDREWEEVYREAYEHLEPGGWIERLEVDVMVRCDDDTLPPDSILATIGPQFVEMAKTTENAANTADTMRGMIEAAGFVNVHEKLVKVPIGPWAKHPIYKQAGSVNMIAFKSGLEGWIMHLFTKHGKPKPWTVEEVHEYLEKVTRELDNAWHIYQYNRRVWAQKPMEENNALKRRRPSIESDGSGEAAPPAKHVSARASKEGTESPALGKEDRELEKTVQN